MAKLTTQVITQAGVVPSFAAADAAGDTIDPGPATFLHVKNASAAAVTVTVDSVQRCSQGADHNLAVAVAAGAESMIGPLDAGRFAQSSGLVNVTYSAVASVTVGPRST